MLVKDSASVGWIPDRQSNMKTVKNKVTFPLLSLILTIKKSTIPTTLSKCALVAPKTWKVKRTGYTHLNRIDPVAA